MKNLLFVCSENRLRSPTFVSLLSLFISLSVGLVMLGILLYANNPVSQGVEGLSFNLTILVFLTADVTFFYCFHALFEKNTNKNIHNKGSGWIKKILILALLFLIFPLLIAVASTFVVYKIYSFYTIPAIENLGLGVLQVMAFLIVYSMAVISIAIYRKSFFNK